LNSNFAINIENQSYEFFKETAGYQHDETGNQQ